MTDQYFCLDISERFIKVVDAKKDKDLIDISAMDKVNTLNEYFPSESEKSLDEQAGLITQLVSNLKINKKNVNIVIPDSMTYNQILTMPYLNEKELISAIKYQADQFIPMPIDDTNIDLEIIREFKAEKKLLILIVAAEKKLINKIQTTVELAGLIPESIENELSANARFFSEASKKKTEADLAHNFFVVNFGFNSSNISYYEEDSPLLKESHNLSLGYQLFFKETKVNTGIDEKRTAELLQNYAPGQQSSYPLEKIVAPLLREFAAGIKRFVGTKQATKIYFINQIIHFPGLPGLLQKELPMSISVLNPYSLIKPSTTLEGLKYELPLYISTLGGNLR